MSLAAQVLTHRFTQPQVVVGTSNPGHLSLFVTATDWRAI